MATDTANAKQKAKSTMQNIGHIAAAYLPQLGELAQIALQSGVRLSPQAQIAATILLAFNQLHQTPPENTLTSPAAD